MTNDVTPQNNTTDAQPIYTVIAQEFGFTDLDDQQQEALVMQMTESVIKRVLVDAYAKLSDGDRTQFEEMLENIDNLDPADVDTFLRGKLTDYDALITDAIADLKKHLMEAA